MNRDIFKFRVWDEKRKLYTLPGDLSIDTDGELWENCTQLDNSDNHLVIEQCTGLKDRNGKLIFEGDIVKPTDPEEKGLYIVQWNNSTYGFEFQKVNGFKSEKFYYLYADDVVIVGNIHEKEN